MYQTLVLKGFHNLERWGLGGRWLSRSLCLDMMWCEGEDQFSVEEIT